MPPTAGPRTFISYARADSDFALKLAEDLRAAGINIWLDRFDIPVGANWPQAVQQALDLCDQFLFILSPASVGSPDVMAEVDYALAEGKQIFPVLNQNCKAPFRIRSAQYADFTIDYQRGFADLLKVLVIRSAEAETKEPKKTQPHPAVLVIPSTRPWRRHYKVLAIATATLFGISGWWTIVQLRKKSSAIDTMTKAAVSKTEPQYPRARALNQKTVLKGVVPRPPQKESLGGKIPRAYLREFGF